LLAALNVKERKLLLALRMGRTMSDIAAADGLNGHASISRRINALKPESTPFWIEVQIAAALPPIRDALAKS
jgi:hypothetical protein